MIFGPRVDGVFWHSSKKARKRDHFKDMILKRLGWKVLRFWDTEIEGDIDWCLGKILSEV